MLVIQASTPANLNLPPFKARKTKEENSEETTLSVSATAAHRVYVQLEEEALAFSLLQVQPFFVF